MSEITYSSLKDMLAENKGLLTEEQLEQAIDILNLAVPQARKNDLKEWEKVRPSVSMSISKIEYQPADDIRLFGARLLTKSEFDMYKNDIPNIKTSWFLDSSQEELEIACIVCSNKISRVHVSAHYGIRPALEIASHGDDLKVGDYFQLGVRSYRLLSDKLAICIAPYDVDWYDSLNNNYDKARIKFRIDSFFNNLVNKRED